MSRHPLFHVFVVGFATWLAFVIHSCGAGRPVKDRHGAGEVDAAPLVQVGLGRCLRDAVVRISVRGPYQVRGRSETLARGGELPFPAQWDPKLGIHVT